MNIILGCLGKVEIYDEGDDWDIEAPGG